MAEQDSLEQNDGWDELDQALLELDNRAMVLEELDGFIAGLLVCPELIPGSEWLPVAFGFDNGQAPFTDIDHANALLAQVEDYYNNVLLTLIEHPEDYSPLLSIDENSDEVIWALWMEGFAAAMNLRPESWKTLLNAGGKVAAATTSMMTLVEAACSEPPNLDLYDRVATTAPQTIVDSVVILHEHRLANQKVPGFADQPNPFAGTAKVGRNDPCPCGSGKKYKRCCGMN